MTRTLEVGAVGWKHPEWVDTFYPDSLPEDWRLTYYSNEFRWVLVPAEYWKDRDIDSAQWVEDVHDEFSFLLDLPCGRPPDGLDADSIMTAAAPLGEQIGGVVFRLAPEHLPTPAQLTGCLELGAGEVPVHVDCRGVLPDELGAVIARAGARRCWRPAGTEPRDQCHIGILSPADVAGGRRELRARVEAFLAQAAGLTEGELVILFEGDPVRPNLLQDTRVIASLLGV